MEMDVPWRAGQVGVENGYQFNGKELNEDFGLGWYAYGARYYDPAVGRFTGVDPIADQFVWTTSYNYAENEPIGNIDLHGLQKFSFKKLAENATAYVSGVVNAVGSNLLGGAGRGNPADFGDSADYAVAGQTAGDVISVIIGGVEQVLGAGAVIGGSLAVPETGGLSVGVAVKGITLAAHGTVTQSTALKNLREDGKVNMNIDRSGKDFTKKGKQEVIEKNKQANGGTTICENCKTETVPAQKSQKGMTPPKNETQVDHIEPKSKGGAGSPPNGQVLCRDCNRKKSNN